MVIFNNVERAEDRLSELRKMMIKADAIGADNSVIAKAVKDRLNDELCDAFNIREDWKDFNGKVQSSIDIGNDANGNRKITARLMNNELSNAFQRQCHADNIVVSLYIELTYGDDNYMEIGMCARVVIVLMNDDGAMSTNGNGYKIYNKVAKEKGNDTSEIVECAGSIMLEERMNSRYGWYVGNCKINRIKRK